MNIRDFINELAEEKIILWREGESIKYKAPKGAMTKELLSQIKQRKAELIAYLKENGDIQFTKNTKARYEKFPLTDIQNSYLMGRSTMYELGGVACHGYMEMTFDEALDPARLEAAWNKVFQKHDMLRAIVSDSGYQIVQEAVPYVPITTIQVDQETGVGVTQRAELRETLSNKQYQLGEWPMCDLALSRETDKSIVHLSLDMLVADFVSTNILLNDLVTFYRDPDQVILPTTLYRDVVVYLDQKKHLSGQERQAADLYWDKKIPQMGLAPELPVQEDYDVNCFTFTSHKVFLGEEEWSRVCDVAADHKITPSVLVMSAFSEVLALWSSNSKFSINTTLLNRPEVTADIKGIVGDFTDVNVTSVELDYQKNFLERTKELQKNLWVDMEHGAVSGVEVLRRLSKQKKKNVIIPVVYTSTIGMAAESDMTMKYPITYKLSQTPQVYIDCQASEENGGATINWDVRDGVFQAEIIEAMFESFRNMLSQIQSAEIMAVYNPVSLPQKMLAVRAAVNDTQAEIAPQMMEEGFLKSLQLYPGKTALITAEGEYTYKALARYVNQVTAILQAEGVEVGMAVGINCDKGVWQIASALGVLLQGAAYVPVDVSQPAARKNKIISNAQISVLLSDREEPEITQDCKVVNLKQIDTAGLSEDISVLLSTERATDYDRRAYIIYTSGTTGEPKGVIMSHRSAMNTICDVNKTYAVNEEDVFLGLANLSFDLSVYDIFGCCLAGGTLVLPDPELRKDPKHLLNLMIVHGVSIVNCVPAQMQMIMNYVDSLDTNMDMKRRLLVLLSGDWIPTNLPGRIYEKISNSKVVSLGGATEGAIWSISYDILTEMQFTSSVPYGRPMANQRFFVLNEQMQYCPDYVDGSLYIGGIGLSQGYLNDEKLTNEKYVILPQTGERIYRTGDAGYYDSEGVIHFKGREAGDEQVKIHGHRVELAEIRSVLTEHPKVSGAATIALGDTPEELHINAAVSPVRRKADQELVIAPEELETVGAAGRCFEEHVDQELFERWTKKSEAVVVADIYHTLLRGGIFADEDSEYSFESIITEMNIPEKLHKLTKRWLKVLVKEGVIRESDGGYRMIADSGVQLDSKKLWEEFYALEEQFKYGKELVDYLKESSDLLPELIQGQEDPLNILFPQGELDPAMAAYHDNKISNMLNSIAKTEIAYLCKSMNRQSEEKVFRILEVGAGVGGTSLDVIPELKGCNVEYYFTDLSTFFLNKAQGNLAEYDWVKYGIFDINEEFVLQGYEAFSFDLILCANVLHNSKNVHDVMENLKGMLADEGSIVILEETRTSYILLTSMEFKDGLTGFTDERSEADQTFFTRNQWERVFEKHNGKVVYEFPAKESKLDLAGQTIYVVRFKNEYEVIYKEEIKEYLQEMVSPYMVPSNILVLPELPLSENRKVDNKKLKAYFKELENCDAKEVDEEPQTDLEKRLAQIWCEELGLKQIGRNDNFYMIGGDSLLIAQVIGKMLEKIPETKGWEWSTLLTEMMQGPTVRQLSAKIEEYLGDSSKFDDPCMVVLKESSMPNEQSVAKVLFHAGTGTLTPYNTLLSYIQEDAKENESIIGFTFGDDAEYISMETSKTFHLLGQKYGETLKELGYSNYILIGHCVGGLIALESAHYLQGNGKSVSDVTMISTDIPKRKENTMLADASDEVYRNTIFSSLDNELLLERIFAKLIDADSYAAGYRVEEDRLQEYIEYITASGTGDITVEALCNTGGEFEDVAQEFRKLASKSVSERLNALYNTIERPDGKLMEHQLKMLNILFRVFSQNFRCVASYEPTPYDGNLRIFCCEIQGGHFYPGFFEEDYETWAPYAIGKLHFDTIAGWHLDCITEPNMKKNAPKILDFNY